MDQTLRSCAALCGAALLISVPASAVPTFVAGVVDTPGCDVLAIPGTLLDELGTVPPFPAGEQIATSVSTTTISTCAGTDNPLISNVAVSITNLNAIAFSDVWYVANYDTALSNYDGTVLSTEAFRIDAVGANTPLIGGDTGNDGIFAPGETWIFVIQDFANVPGQPADLISDIGLPSAGFGSSGSIVANPVPEPTTAALLGLGLLGMSLGRRRAR